MDLLARLGYMLALLAVGVGARQTGLLGEQRRDLLNAVAFYVALPALIFHSTYQRSLGEIVTPQLVAGLWLVLGATVGIAWLVHARTESRATRSVAVVQSYHSNFGYLGLPLVASTLGGAAAATGSIILGVGALTQVPMTVLLLITMNDADASVTGELRSVATNPVLAALAAGLVVGAVGATPPAPAETALAWASEAALPLALLLIGSSLELALPTETLDTLGAVVGLKVFLMPVLAWAAFTALGADPLTRNAGVIMFGAPTAVSTFVYANELGGDAEFASTTVFATTLVSVATLGVLLGLVV
ncbi:AEC family transporter [Halomicrobium salinisoli]|uniref:AEC family transporter n=1 Tax=Halomicrobium salinisoli TaxID=2878391 RepID=UPI001CEFC2E0|nr:AEC family transporter [Halomicrobium salinisoli]